MADDPIKRARKHEAAGEIDQALAAYREVGASAPSYAEARIRIVGIAMLRGQLQEAEVEARAFVTACPTMPESHATLGQVLRLSFRHDEAIGAFRKAVELAPQSAGYRMLLNDARRARYWAPDADLCAGLEAHVASGKAGPSARIRHFHLQLAALLSPEVQHWLTDSAAIEKEEKLPAGLRRSLDARFEGRFSRALDEAVGAWKVLRAEARARMTLADGGTREGGVEDSDGTIGAALEAIDGDEYAILPFGELSSIEFGGPGPYVRTRVTPREGRPREVEMPALYFFTEGCRKKDLRDGRRTAWRLLAGGLRVGLGLRAFLVHGASKTTLVGLDRVKRIDFLP